MIAKGMFPPNWTRRASTVTARNLVRTDVKVRIFSAYSVASLNEKDIQSTGQMRTKLKNPTASEDETMETATETRQGHRGLVNRV